MALEVECCGLRGTHGAQTAAAALVVDCRRLGGTAGLGHERAQAAAELGARTQCRRLCRPGMLEAGGKGGAVKIEQNN